MSKSPDAFRTISEVADDLDLPQHVLRFWETRFNQIKPMKRGGGRRYYRPDDVTLLKGIRFLLYAEGYTIKGVQRILKEHGNKFVMAIADGSHDPSALAGAATVKQAAVPTVAGLDGPLSPDGTKGILGKLVKGLSTDDEKHTGQKDTAAKAGGEFAVSDIQLLNDTLMELLECKRLLDQAR